jgi:hypothetical protein
MVQIDDIKRLSLYCTPNTKYNNHILSRMEHLQIIYSILKSTNFERKKGVWFIT